MNNYSQEETPRRHSIFEKFHFKNINSNNNLQNNVETESSKTHSTSSSSSSSSIILSSLKDKNQEIEIIKKQGWLYKQKGIFRKFRPYWFELDELSEYVTYYRKPPSMATNEPKNLVGTINLEGAKIEIDKHSYTKIRIKTFKGKNFVLNAPSNIEREQWFEAFIKSRDFAQSSKMLLEEWKKHEELKEYIDDSLLTDEGDEKSEAEEDTDNEIFDVDEEELDKLEDILKLQVKQIMKDELQEFFSLYVETEDEKIVQLKQVIGRGSPTFLILLRSFGCCVCRQQAGRLLQRKSDFDQLGIPIVAIAPGTPAMAKSFAKEYNFPGKIYIDNEKKVYDVLSCKKGIKYAFDLRAMDNIRKALTSGFKQQIPSRKDLIQLGGAFVVSQKGGFIYKKLEMFTGDHPDLDEVLNICENYLKEHPYELWSNKPIIKKYWSEVISIDNDKYPPLVVLSDESYNKELGRNNVIYSTSKICLEESENDIHYYKEIFYGKEHINLMGNLDQDSHSFNLGYVIISMELPTPEGSRVIIRTKKGERRLIIPVEMCAHVHDMIQYIQKSQTDLENVKLKKIKDPEIVQLLIKYEECNIINNYKFGVLYAKGGQNEIEMYSNVEASESFEEFLEFLGEKIRLKDYQGYSGGLDVQSDTTGKYSVATTFNNINIMFHVSILLPYEESDEQRVERKKHIGNDVVVIIFKEGDKPIDPSKFNSQFNHIFAIVEKINDTSLESKETFYRICFVNKTGVQPYGPYLPFPAIMKKDKNTREFFLSKLINGERSAMHAAHFSSRIRTRKELLADIIQHVKQHSKKSIHQEENKNSEKGFHLTASKTNLFH